MEPVGKFLRVDQATTKRDRLQFARIFIEVKVDQEFPDQLSILMRKGLTLCMIYVMNGSLIFVQPANH